MLFRRRRVLRDGDRCEVRKTRGGTRIVFGSAKLFERYFQEPLRRRQIACPPSRVGFVIERPRDSVPVAALDEQLS